MRFVDLFAGLGGFHLALATAGSYLRLSPARSTGPAAMSTHGTSGSGRRGISGDPSPPSPTTISSARGSLPALLEGRRTARAGRSARRRPVRLRDRGVCGRGRRAYVILENVPNLERHGRGGPGLRWRRSCAGGLRCPAARALAAPVRYPAGARRACSSSPRGALVARWLRLARPARPIRTPVTALVLDHSPEDARPITAAMRRCLEVWQEFLERFPADAKLPSVPDLVDGVRGNLSVRGGDAARCRRRAAAVSRSTWRPLGRRRRRVRWASVLCADRRSGGSRPGRCSSSARTATCTRPPGLDRRLAAALRRVPGQPAEAGVELPGRATATSGATSSSSARPASASSGRPPRRRWSR